MWSLLKGITCDQFSKWSMLLYQIFCEHLKKVNTKKKAKALVLFIEEVEDARLKNFTKHPSQEKSRLKQNLILFIFLCLALSAWICTNFIARNPIIPVAGGGSRKVAIFYAFWEVKINFFGAWCAQINFVRQKFVKMFFIIIYQHHLKRGKHHKKKFRFTWKS